MCVYIYIHIYIYILHIGNESGKFETMEKITNPCRELNSDLSRTHHKYNTNIMEVLIHTPYTGKHTSEQIMALIDFRIFLKSSNYQHNS